MHSPLPPPQKAHLHVVALTDVVDVCGYAGVSADAVLLHQTNQLSLTQVVGRLQQGEDGVGRRFSRGGGGWENCAQDARLSG